MNAGQLRQYLEFYRDLGIQTLYKRTAPQSGTGAFAGQTAPEVRKVLPDMAPDSDTLAIIQSDIGDCKRCRLHEARNKIVFGVGSERAPLVFVGEGPGADEDEQGIPLSVAPANFSLR